MAQGTTRLPGAPFGGLPGKGAERRPTKPEIPTAGPHLLFQIGGNPSRTVALRLSERIQIGRLNHDGSGDPVDLDLTPFRAVAYGVSRLHAVIYYQDRELEVEDLGSTNGTRINGLQIAPNVRTRLHSGDELEFGKLRVVVRLVLGAR